MWVKTSQLVCGLSGCWSNFAASKFNSNNTLPSTCFRHRRRRKKRVRRIPQLYIAAAITSLVAIFVFGALVRQMSSSQYFWKLLGLACLGLPLSPLAYFIVRLPLIHIIEPALLGATQDNPNGTVSTAVRDGIRLLYAPLTEEPVKLLPWIALLMFGVLRKPSRKQLVPVAIAIGVSFAIGEFLSRSRLRSWLGVDQRLGREVRRLSSNFTASNSRPKDSKVIPQ